MKSSNHSVVEKISVKNNCAVCFDCNEENEYIQAIKEELRKLRKIFGDQRKETRKQ